MARYRKSGVKFSPFTYEQMLAPIVEIQKVHDELEKNYGALKVEAAQWQNKADREKDPVAHAQYSRFAADLNNQAQLLSSSGVTPLLKRGIYDMAGRYAAEIQPIEEAYKRRVLLADEQRKLEQQDPTRLFQRQADQMSLDEFLRNPQADYGNSVSGALLTAQVAQAAEALSKEARDSEEGRGKLKKLVLPYQYEYIKQQGFKREDILQAIARNPNASKILTGLVDQVIGSSGVLDWGDPSTIQKAYWYAGQGLYKAIGQTTSQIVTDSYSMQDALARKAAARAARKEKTDKDERGTLNTLTAPRKVLTKKQLDQKEKMLNNFIEAGYIVKSGKGYKVTSKGMNAYRSARYAQKNPSYANDAYYDPKTGDRYAQGIINPFKLSSKNREVFQAVHNTPALSFMGFMDQQAEVKYGKGEKAWRGKDEYKYGHWSTQEMSNLITESFSDPSYGADVIGKTEIYTPYNDSDGKMLKSELSGVGGESLRILGLDENGDYSIENGRISKATLQQKGYSLKGKGSGLGNVLYINTPDGNVIVTERGNFGTLPERTYNEQVHNLYRAATILDNPNNYSPEEIAIASEIINSGVAAQAADQSAVLIHTGIGSSSFNMSSKEDNLNYNIPVGQVDFGGIGGIY